MNQVIIYSSRYGSTLQYAKKLSEQTNIPAVDYREAPELSGMRTIIYMGGLYAGGVPGLTKTFRGFSLRDGQKVILITIGLSDPDEPENRQNIRAALKKQLPPDLFHQAKIFHLRGGIDYQRLALSHRTMLALLYRSLRKTPLEQQTAENRALIETYGKQVNFIDFGALEAVIREIQHEKTPHYCEVSNAEDGT